MFLTKFADITSLPKSLWRFYWEYGFNNYKSLLLLWMLAFLFVSLGDGVFFPNFQRWVVAIFESPIPEGVSLLQHAMPTIILITVINVILTIGLLIHLTVSSRIQPVMRNKISETLTGYTYQQSMSFWANKMSGSINNQIEYIEKGALAFYDLFEVICLIAVVLITALAAFRIFPVHL